jgi:hypothetical protein
MLREADRGAASAWVRPVHSLAARLDARDECLKELDMTDRRSLELFAIWGGFFGGTIIWILIGVSGVPLSITRAVFMFAATVFTLGAVVRALLLTQPRGSSPNS